MAATTTPPIEDIANKPEPADAPALGESRTPADPAREFTDAGAEGTTVPAPPQAPDDTPELEASNDNQPAEELPATGTDG
jgi:hypothetical protein